MRSSIYFAPSAVAILSTALLLGLGGTAMSQPTAGPQLPSVTVDAPRQLARPQRPVVTPQRPPRVTNTVAPSRTTTATAIRSTSPAAILAGPGTTMQKFAAFERISNNCNDGCQTSFKYKNQPWNGCSVSGGVPPPFSPTCRNVHNYKTYAECSDTGAFLSGDRRGSWWYCSSLLAGGKLAGEKLAGAPYQVADVKRSARR